MLLFSAAVNPVDVCQMTFIAAGAVSGLIAMMDLNFISDEAVETAAGALANLACCTKTREVPGAAHAASGQHVTPGIARRRDGGSPGASTASSC